MHTAHSSPYRGVSVWAVSVMETPLDRDPQTETPQAETPLWRNIGPGSQTGSNNHTETPTPCGQNDWHTPVKILPCPKLRLRAVIIPWEMPNYSINSVPLCIFPHTYKSQFRHKSHNRNCSNNGWRATKYICSFPRSLQGIFSILRSNKRVIVSWKTKVMCPFPIIWYDCTAI